MSIVIKNGDIQVTSQFALTCSQGINDAIQSKPIVNAPGENLYKDYRPTKLQFELASSVLFQEIELVIPYHNRLTSIEAKNAIVCIYDNDNQQWKKMSFIMDTDNKSYVIKSDRIGVYGIFVNYYWYSSFTQHMADEYPMWTRIRKTKDSLGQRFLNFFGLHLEEIEEYLNWVQEQKHIGTVDVHMLDWAFVYDLMEIKQSDDIRVFYQKDGRTKRVPILETIREFFYNPSNEGGIIDYGERRFYTTKSYGDLRVRVKRGTQIAEFSTAPRDYHIWNTLDEFGLLVGVKRLHLEKNVNYKERILDVFRYPANTSDEGLTNGIARELDMITRIQWNDDRKSFFIKNISALHLDIRTLRVDGMKLEEGQYKVDHAKNILIHPMNTGSAHVVSFIQGIEKYELHDKTNEEFHQLAYQEDGQATSRLVSWVEYINTVVPVMWDRFKWDEGFWDTIDKKLTGLGYVPNIWDSDIEIWKTYTFDPKRWESESIWR